MTLKEAYQTGENKLSQAGIQEARLDAWYLLEHVTGIGRAMYYAMPERALTEEQQEQYSMHIEDRAKRIPLQHLTGEQEFMGLTFHVDEHVLIPRQDTETVVEEAMIAIRELKKCRGSMSRKRLGTCLKQNQNQKDRTAGKTDVRHNPKSGVIQDDPKLNIRVLDMCTGSGCILLSMIHHAIKDTELLIDGLGVDISPKALEVARLNSKLLNIEAKFLCSDLFEHVEGAFQMIISNPPYIRTDRIDSLQEEVRGHDPILALDGKEDGLFFYRRIIRKAGDYLTPGGMLIFEIGSDQGEAVKDLMLSAGYRNVLVKKDLAGLDRVVIGVYDK